jgi:hypothetical protein
LEAKKIVVTYHLSHLLRPVVEIDSLHLEEVTLMMTLTDLSGESNWTELLRTMPPSSSHRFVSLNQWSMNALSVRQTQPGLDPQTLTFDHLEGGKIDSPYGFPTKELIETIFQAAGLEHLLYEDANAEIIE